MLSNGTISSAKNVEMIFGPATINIGKKYTKPDGAVTHASGIYFKGKSMTLPNEFVNCKKTERFKELNPEKYKEAITRLAELQDIRNRIAELRDYEKGVVSDIYDLLPKNQMDIAGIGRITRSKSRSRKWDHESIIPVIVARGLDARRIDKETGEVLEREGWAVARVMAECAGIGYWRLQALEDYGIQADEYYEETSARPSVRIQN